jgi:cytochrome b561
VFLFAAQYLTATIMLRTPTEATTLGVNQASYHNWHKSLGLVALIVAIARLINRRSGELPPWAPGLSALEQFIIHRAERLLYAAMFVMPVSGFLYVMAGGYGVLLFGLIDLPNPIPSSTLIASIAKWTPRSKRNTTSLAVRNPSRHCFGPSLWAERPPNRPHFAW